MKTKQQLGFTILELLITILIVGIVSILAVPGMNQFVMNERLTSTTNTLLTDLMLARSKAVEQNLPTIVCVSTNQTNCTAGTFSDGWIVGVDENNDGGLDAAELIKVQQPISGSISFTSSVGASIQFDNRGFNPGAVGLISVCDERGVDHARSLSISRTGRISRGGTPVC